MSTDYENQVLFQWWAGYDASKFISSWISHENLKCRQTSLLIKVQQCKALNLFIAFGRNQRREVGCLLAEVIIIKSQIQHMALPKHHHVARSWKGRHSHQIWVWTGNIQIAHGHWGLFPSGNWNLFFATEGSGCSCAVKVQVYISKQS